MLLAASASLLACAASARGPRDGQRAPLPPISPGDPVVIQLPDGPIRGSQTLTTRFFRGVPYAKPPLGELRWKPPVAPDPWGPEPRDATRFGASCPQKGGWPTINLTVISEDCLFLNVYAPVPSPDATPKEGYPVMVYLHAGEFRYGSSNDAENNWPYFSNTTVLVTIK